jgi:integrase
VKFLFRVTLRRPDLVTEIYHLREPQKIPLVMSQDETRRLLAVASGLKVRVLLSLSYGCGLRAGEVVRLKVKHIDSAQKIIRHPSRGPSLRVKKSAIPVRVHFCASKACRATTGSPRSPFRSGQFPDSQRAIAIMRPIPRPIASVQFRKEAGMLCATNAAVEIGSTALAPARGCPTGEELQGNGCDHTAITCTCNSR